MTVVASKWSKLAEISLFGQIAVGTLVATQMAMPLGSVLRDLIESTEICESHLIRKLCFDFSLYLSC